jgi:hypothetical protein
MTGSPSPVDAAQLDQVAIRTLPRTVEEVDALTAELRTLRESLLARPGGKPDPSAS